MLFTSTHYSSDVRFVLFSLHSVPPQLEFICTDLMNPRCYFANTEKESGEPCHKKPVFNIFDQV